MALTLEERLIKEETRAIVHLRAQRKANRFGLIFGAGIGIDLGYPQWPDLVKRIANHPEVGATRVWSRLEEQGASGRPVTRSLASVTQMLFSQFRRQRIEKQGLLASLTYAEELSIKTDWLKIIHTELYDTLPRETREHKLRTHPYLNSFLPIVKETQLTITYNFDDSLEMMLSLARTADEKLRTRGYEVLDNPFLQCRHRHGVIYHPNGYLPAEFGDGTSADVVFSDDSFQDQLLAATNGGYFHLTNHLTQNTCLMVGLSLEDSTLQSMLRQNAVRNPGHIHYVVHFMPDAVTRDPEAERAIFTTNFESFGVYTLFLGSRQIKSLADLIQMDEGAFASLYAKYKPKFVYYLIGSVGAGKSTAAAHLRSLITYDEWVDERLPELAKPEVEVSAEKVDPMNEWIAEQFRKKNFALHGCEEGIHVVDRAPLDPLTFGGEGERPTKAKALMATITDDDTRRIVPGHLIELRATADELQIRTRRRHKAWPKHELERLLYGIDQVYGPLSRSQIDTSGRPAASVAKEIARVIHLEPYRPVDIQAELAKFAAAADA